MKKPTKQTPQINLPSPVLSGFLKHILPVKSGIKSPWQMLPKDIYILMFGMCEYVTAHGIGGGVAHVIRLRVLAWEEYSAASRWVAVTQVGCFMPISACGKPMLCLEKAREQLVHKTSGRNAGWGPILDFSPPAPSDNTFPLFWITVMETGCYSSGEKWMHNPELGLRNCHGSVLCTWMLVMEASMLTI